MYAVVFLFLFFFFFATLFWFAMLFRFATLFRFVLDLIDFFSASRRFFTSGVHLFVILEEKFLGAYLFFLKRYPFSFFGGE
jgi:hypothetical protein